MMVIQHTKLETIFPDNVWYVKFRFIKQYTLENFKFLHHLNVHSLFLLYNMTVNHYEDCIT